MPVQRHHSRTSSIAPPDGIDFFSFVETELARGAFCAEAVHVSCSAAGWWRCHATRSWTAPSAESSRTNPASTHTNDRGKGRPRCVDAAVQVSDRGVGDVVERFPGVGDALAAVEFGIDLLDRSAPSLGARLFRLHAAKGIAELLGRISVEAAQDLALVEGLALQRVVDVHRHVGSS